MTIEKTCVNYLIEETAALNVSIEPLQTMTMAADSNQISYDEKKRCLSLLILAKRDNERREIYVP